MRALEDFRITLTFCFTPEQRGLRPHHTSPPQQAEEFADFCAAMTRRYVGHSPFGFAAQLRTREAQLNGSRNDQDRGVAEIVSNEPCD
jgi:hypothetical protein